MPHPPVSMIHDVFVTAIEGKVEGGVTADERRLAATLLDLYVLVQHDPQVVSFINRWGADLMNRTEPT